MWLSSGGPQIIEAAAVKTIMTTLMTKHYMT